MKKAKLGRKGFPTIVAIMNIKVYISVHIYYFSLEKKKPLM